MMRKKYPGLEEKPSADERSKYKSREQSVPLNRL
jgi:hypothetical protein